MSRLAGWWRSHLGAALIAGAAAALVVAAAFIWPITDLIAAHDVGQIAGPQRATQLQTAREAVRTQLLTLAAGVFVAGALWFTAQNFRLSRQGQVTDRYTKAIEQLGSDKLDVRIGAVYALERIARDSATDHPTVMEVLAAFIREHSREQWPPSADDEPSAAAPERRTRPDVQAAVTVIGRRNARHDREPVNLRHANLTGAVVTGDLTGAKLDDANLTSAELTSADLTGADLLRTNLKDADLVNTDLTGAYLIGAILANANLAGTVLAGACLFGADLTGAALSGANLTGADLREAGLTGAYFVNANLTDAMLNEGQPVPEGWLRDPDPDSGRLRPASRDGNDTG